VLEHADDAIVAAVTLSDRYVTDRNLPDKAIDVLDEACSKLKISDNKSVGGSVPFVTAENIAEVISKSTGVPVTKLTGGDREILASLEDELKKGIIGQDKAVSFISKAIRRSRAGVSDANRPVGSFMFLGRTGVGKTEVCKVLAKHLFSNEKSLIKLDMSEFTESHSISKLIGSPPGYVGYDDGAVLCDRVRRNPYCIVLFDEIEKAHPDIYNVLLQVLDEGRLTDNRGKTTSFRNAMIIMTSNTGVENLSKTATIGFSTGDEASNGEETLIMNGLKKRFRPEFINRIDNVVVFNSLTADDVLKIAHLRVNELIRKMDGAGITLKVDASVVKMIVDKGFDREFGARPIKRLIQTELEDPIAEKICSSDTATKYCHVTLDDGKPKFTF
jgi:ATP-dependent Clp protease ATP-binding subunit ClpC